MCLHCRARYQIPYVLREVGMPRSTRKGLIWGKGCSGRGLQYTCLRVLIISLAVYIMFTKVQSFRTVHQHAPQKPNPSYQDPPR